MTLLTLIVPRETERQNIAAEGLLKALAPLGFSRYEGIGAWYGPDDRLQVEEHDRVEVACSDHEDVNAALAIFREYGREAGEHTLYHTEQEVEAHFEVVEGAA